MQPQPTSTLALASCSTTHLPLAQVGRAVAAAVRGGVVGSHPQRAAPPLGLVAVHFKDCWGEAVVR